MWIDVNRKEIGGVTRRVEVILYAGSRSSPQRQLQGRPESSG